MTEPTIDQLIAALRLIAELSDKAAALINQRDLDYRPPVDDLPDSVEGFEPGG